MKKLEKTERLNLAAAPEFIRKLDEWRRRQPDIPNRSETLRRIAERVFSEDLEAE
jgi:hypothetical protein